MLLPKEVHIQTKHVKGLQKCMGLSHWIITFNLVPRQVVYILIRCKCLPVYLNLKCPFYILMVKILPSKFGCQCNTLPYTNFPSTFIPLPLPSNVTKATKSCSTECLTYFVEGALSHTVAPSVAVVEELHPYQPGTERTGDIERKK